MIRKLLVASIAAAALSMGACSQDTTEETTVVEEAPVEVAPPAEVVVEGDTMMAPAEGEATAPAEAPAAE